MDKYKQNLRIQGNKVFSYSTHVATIDGGRLLVHGYWSKTTSKHINYVANQYGLTKVDAPLEEKKENSGGDSMLRTVAMVAKMGEVFTSSQKEGNDWKMRMIKAGIPPGALHMPENWDSLPEDEKQRRLDKVIEVFSETK